MSANTLPTLVTISYCDLLNNNCDLSPYLKEAFGPDGLGIITIRDIPDYSISRAALLPLVARFAAQPQHIKAQYVLPELSYTIGWSEGEEHLSAHKADTYKGSFYANPVCDSPVVSDHLKRLYPDFYGDNIWPTKHLPELEPRFKQLGGLIVDVGKLLAKHCDRYIASILAHPPDPSVSQILQNSKAIKGRLLHYAPATESVVGAEQQFDQWCGWHTDHGALTGLTAALYMRDGKMVANPDCSSGLHIKTRHGAVVKVDIPDDHMAFQVGEVLQILSGGALMATPHCVRASSGPATAGVSRNTLAVFLQPDLDYEMTLPTDLVHAEAAVERWQPGTLFGEFCQATLRTYYSR